MTVSHNTTGAVNSGGASCAPAYAATVNAGEMAVLFVAWGNDANTAPATPSGWNLLGTWTGGAGTWGVDDGPRGVTVFYRETTGTEDGTTVTVTNGGSGATRVITGQIMQATKTAAAWYITAVGASDNSNDTSFSIAPASDPGPAVAGDLAYFGGVWRPDSVTPVSPTIDYPGIGASATTAVQSIANTNGNDLRMLIYRRNLSSGTSSGAPSFTSSPTSAVSGAGVIVLLHDGAAADQTVNPSGIASTATLGSPTVTPGAVTVSPSGITSTTTLGSPTVTPGAVTVSPAGIDSSTALGSPTVTPGEVTVGATGIGSTATLGSPTVTSDSGDATVSPNGIASTASLGTPTVTPGAVTVSPNGIDSTAAVGSPVVTPGGVTASPNGIGSAVIVGTPTVTPGEVTVQPAAIDSTSSLGTPALAPGGVTVTLSSVASTVTVGTPTVAPEGETREFTATILPARYQASIDGPRYVAVISSRRFTATIAPARYNAQIEAA